MRDSDIGSLREFVFGLIKVASRAKMPEFGTASSGIGTLRVVR
ncbi:hypothetical protein RLEG3_08325 (plasmid) [Rhizobium leguminosarum bv. trifolii WSM1689]|nr:hypothetical protein RLEG3_08325 [Rhizobium leguminosarum bv. trifolii WSM1689]